MGWPDGVSQVRTGGLRLLPRDAIGTCAPSASAGVGTAVVFNEATAVSCTTRYTAAAFAAMCAAQTPANEQPMIAALNLTANTLIGSFGDSHPNMANDWVPLTIRYPQGGDASQLVTTWNAPTQTCSKVLSGIHLRVLTAEVGAVHHPVSKVVGAELSLTSRSVATARCTDAFRPSGGGAACETTVIVSASVSFAKIDSQSFEFIPESPTLIPPLPYDFFYPFFMDANNPSR